MSFRQIGWINYGTSGLCLAVAWYTESHAIVGVAAWIALVTGVFAMESIAMSRRGTHETAA